jgi:hypothetical protein
LVIQTFDINNPANAVATTSPQEETSINSSKD